MYTCIESGPDELCKLPGRSHSGAAGGCPPRSESNFARGRRRNGFASIHQAHYARALERERETHKEASARHYSCLDTLRRIQDDDCTALMRGIRASFFSRPKSFAGVGILLSRSFARRKCTVPGI